MKYRRFIKKLETFSTSYTRWTEIYQFLKDSDDIDDEIRKIIETLHWDHETTLDKGEIMKQLMQWTTEGAYEGLSERTVVSEAIKALLRTSAPSSVGLIDVRMFINRTYRWMSVNELLHWIHQLDEDDFRKEGSGDAMFFGILA